MYEARLRVLYNVIQMKKAQGISVTTIIIAAIALIVLVVLIAIFTGRMGVWGQGLDTTQEGKACTDTDVDGEWRVKCYDGTESGQAKETAIYGLFSDAKDHPGQSCCKSA